MVTLDIQTLAIHFILSNLLIAMLFAIGFRERKDRYARLWVGSLLIQAITWMLIIDQTNPFNELTKSVGVSLMCLGIAMLSHAFMDFYRVPVARRWLYLPVALTTVFLIATSWLDGALVLRIVVGGIVLGGQMLFGGLIILTRKDRWRGLRGVIGLSAVVMAAVFFLRAFVAVSDPAELPQFPATSPLQTLSFLVGSVAKLTFVFGFLLLIETRRYDEITRLAALDCLTGAFNRRTFIEIAERELAHCWRSRQPLALMLIDLDHFKSINDTHGHLAGDQVLVKFKELADGCLRRQDTFGRYGGEEFCVLAPGTDAWGAVTLAERMRAEVESCSFETSHKAAVIHTTISIGVVVFDPDESHVSLDSLFAKADERLYLAKNQGRNRVIGPDVPLGD